MSRVMPNPQSKILACATVAADGLSSVQPAGTCAVVLLDRPVAEGEAKYSKAVIAGAGLGIPPSEVFRPEPGAEVVVLFVPSAVFRGKDAFEIQADIGLPWFCEGGDPVWFEDELRKAAQATGNDPAPAPQPVETRPLIAFQVGDNDVVAAYDAAGAIAVLCAQNDQATSEFDLADVEVISDEHLDAMEAYDQDEGKTVRLETSLRQDVAALTEPTYLFGWE